MLLGVGSFFDGKVQGYSFLVPQENSNTQNKRYGVQETGTEICGTVDVWITVRLQTLFSELQRVNILQKEQKKSRILPASWIKRWKIGKTMASPKSKIGLTKNCRFAQVTHSHTRPHFTVQSAKPNCLVTG